ncbi:hypothetical protein DYD21_01325 [Rhodohalobacter sp. SW132]|uniref:cbb3-type cytochrome c oxidase subunit I n=1 Tax=Rhodohalobacter sp. SW132 TaxID=2293433 RepID=UPI000E22D932|nr:cbb3-type cytochrome c oxidase subunit I [Rhodohalobacter sp. SW132]REL38618.1 hypothetical protein DYD21_01325 [Rhodohalobacter sp. SW132]
MLPIVKKAISLPIEIWQASALASEKDYSRSWLKIGLFSLLLSGLFSAVIVIARTPGTAEFIGDPLFARKSLVLHVDFALVVWFYAFLSVLHVSLNRSVSFLQMAAGTKLALCGLLLMIASIFFKGAEPILANYIPVLDHPVFIGGLLVFSAGILITFPGNLSVFSIPKPESPPSFFNPAAQLAIRYAGIVVMAAIFTFMISWMLTSNTIDRTLYYELIMWGGGHILQFANVLGMLTVWLILIYKITGKIPVGKRVNFILLSVLAVPAVLSPILLLNGTGDQLYYSGYTQLMRWFIFPVVTIYLILGSRAIWLHYSRLNKQKNPFRSLYFNGFLVSALLTVTGFVLGAMIRGSSTLIPAHYHASLGGVTVAYMVMVFILLKEYGYQLTTRKSIRLMKLQPLLFGFGQTMFVIGFAIAGMMGMGRKLFGQDQNIYSVEALTGLGLMSLGGLLAMAGGILFIYIVVKSYTNSQNR